MAAAGPLPVTGLQAASVGSEPGPGGLPPTAPFAMLVLVGLGMASWSQVTASALISMACTVGLARVAARIYRRAILRTGSRVRLREVLPARERR